MLSIITNNPFRILGVYSNSPTKDIISNEGKMKAFLKVGKDVSFPIDFSSFLPAIKRNEEIVANAKSQIALPKDKLKFAQFWFIKLDSIDDTAFNSLTKGDYHQALVLWGRNDSISSLQNRTVLYLMLNNWASAISYAEKLYGSYADGFTKAVDQQAKPDKNTLINQFVDCLFNEKVDLFAVKNSISNQEWINAINSKISKPIAERLEKELEIAKQSRGNGGNARLNAGNKLMSIVKSELPNLKSVIDQLQYQLLADKLANEILQCGIDYFNGSEDYNAANNVLPLQEYAYSIAVGSIVKERCKENLFSLKEIISNLPPQKVFSEEMAVRNLLYDFCNKPDSIQRSIDLLKAAKPYIKSMKTKLGAKDAHYLRLSTLVVSNALNSIISKINEAQNLFAEYDSPFRSRDTEMQNFTFKILSDELSLAQKAKKLMNKYDMEKYFKQRYKQNMETLDKISKSNFVSTTSEKLGCKVGIVVIIIGAIVGAFIAHFNKLPVGEGAGIGAAVGFGICILVYGAVSD